MKKRTFEAITEVNKDGTMIAVASDESKDRYGDEILVKDWDFSKFKKNPVLQAGHDYRPQFTVGIAKNMKIEGKKVLFEPVFHNITSLAREIGEMYKQGVLKAWSVGFIPSRKEGGKNELLEVSAVAVPANANALVIAKGMNQEEEKEVGEKLKEFVKKETKQKGRICPDCQTPDEIMEEVDAEVEEKPKKTPKKKKKTIKAKKSPACRKKGETEEDCVSRKIPEILNEDSEIEEEQAVAMASKMCKTECKKKEKTKKEKYSCECIECGHKEKTDKHCKDIKCSECGGEMRRVERPGSGKEVKDIKIKAGKVISAKNRKMIDEAIIAGKQAVTALEKLIELSEPSPKEESKKEIEQTPNKGEGSDVKIKGREPKKAHKKLTSTELAVHTLKQISKQTNFALNQVNKES